MNQAFLPYETMDEGTLGNGRCSAAHALAGQSSQPQPLSSLLDVIRDCLLLTGRAHTAEDALERGANLSERFIDDPAVGPLAEILCDEWETIISTLKGGDADIRTAARALLSSFRRVAHPEDSFPDLPPHGSRSTTAGDYADLEDVSPTGLGGVEGPLDKTYSGAVCRFSKVAERVTSRLQDNFAAAKLAAENLRRKMVRSRLQCTMCLQFSRDARLKQALGGELPLVGDALTALCVSTECAQLGLQQVPALMARLARQQPSVVAVDAFVAAAEKSLAERRVVVA